MKDKKETKGIWIPLNIWLISELSLIERIFFSQIQSLDNSARGCYASNSYFADLFDITSGRASQIITSLKKKGFIKISLKYENNQVIERNIKVVNKLSTLYRKLKGVVNILNKGTYNIKGGYLENAQVNNIDLNNIIKQYKKQDFDFFINSNEFKNYCLENNIKVEKQYSSLETSETIILDSEEKNKKDLDIVSFIKDDLMLFFNLKERSTAFQFLNSLNGQYSEFKEQFNDYRKFQTESKQYKKSFKTFTDEWNMIDWKTKLNEFKINNNKDYGKPKRVHDQDEDFNF